jgi:hypothetical protein
VGLDFAGRIDTMGTWGKAAQALAALAVLALAGPASAATAAADLYYERALMAAADGACRLFAPPVSSALAAAKAQARSAALRSGMDNAGLRDIESRADAAAAAAGCASPDIAIAAQRVRQAFDGYAHLDHMVYPGENADWLAARPPEDGASHWRLSQRDRFGWDVMLFGVVGHGDGRPLMAVASFADDATPYGARLVLRDTAITDGPYLQVNQADVAGRIPMDGRLPPRAATRVFNAEAMSPAGRDLRSADMADGWAFRFPPEAEAALAVLDPRETVAVEFLFTGADGDAERTAYVEVGDFAAGQAFEELVQR